MILQKIIGQRFLPLFYNNDIEVCKEVIKALYAAGVRCVEFTNRGSKAVENFSALIRERDIAMPDLSLGIGTIKNAEEATVFIKAGADFLVSPIFDAGICDVARLHNLPWIPGCMTVTEIHTAQKAGYSLVKLFPGNVLGPGFVEAVMPLFTDIDFMVTGGVDTSSENLNAWFKAGVAGVGLGSKLITANILQHKNYEELITKTKAVMAVIDGLKKNKLQ